LVDFFDDRYLGAASEQYQQSECKRQLIADSKGQNLMMHLIYGSKTQIIFIFLKNLFPAHGFDHPVFTY
jgi:hypothetical protein